MARGIKNSAAREYIHLMATESDADIALLCGLSRQRVHEVRDELGIEKIPRGKQIADYAGLHGAKAAAEKFGVRVETVWNQASKYRVYVKRLGASGEIRRDPGLGISDDRIIAAKYGASIDLVGKLRREKEKRMAYR